MAFALWKAAVLSSCLDTPVPTIMARHEDNFIVAFPAILDAVSYQFTTDGGASWLPVVSGTPITTDSRGALLFTHTHYFVQVRAVGIGDVPWDVSPPSEALDIFTSPATPPTMMMLAAYPTEDPTIWLLRAYVSDWGLDVVTIEFRYGLTSAYGSTIILAGTYGDKEIGQVYVKLIADKTYHLQVRCTNTGGVTVSADYLLQTSGDVRWRIYEDVT